MAQVVSVNMSPHKGTPKAAVPHIMLKKDFGVVGDAHAGPGDRQVSLLAIESYQRFDHMKRLCLKHGSFGENIVTEGLELHTLPLGTKLRIGKVALKVSKIGKECHAPCTIAKTVGSCIMPKEGIFCRVIRGGTIAPRDAIQVA